MAIAIPVFTSQLEKSREATDLSNIRSAYAEAMADYLANGATSATAASGKLNQKENSWAMGASAAVLHTRINGSESNVPIPEYNGQTSFTVNVASDGVTTVTLN